MPAPPPPAADLYLDLIARCLTREIFFSEIESGRRPLRATGWKRRPVELVRVAAGRVGVELTRPAPDPEGDRAEGRDWPPTADTMIGRKRLANLRECVESVLRDDVPGDLIETGVWRGGGTIMMRAVLAAHGVTDRTVYVADSFAGLPPPDEERFPQDAGDEHWTKAELVVDVDEVRRRFATYGLLDDQVRFVEGWFADTLAGLDAERFAVIRLDGDMYGSTMDALDALYPKLQPGGYCIVDDHGAVPACAQAVADYRRDHGITEAIEEIDWTGVFWRRT